MDNDTLAIILLCLSLTINAWTIQSMVRMERRRKRAAHWLEQSALTDNKKEIPST